MKLLDVLDSDMKFFAQMINMLHSGEFKYSGKDLCAAADTVRWLQKLATDAAKVYAESKNPVAPVPAPAPVPVSPPSSDLPPASGLGEGVTLKAFNPGKPSRSK